MFKAKTLVCISTVLGMKMTCESEMKWRGKGNAQKQLEGFLKSYLFDVIILILNLSLSIEHATQYWLLLHY